MDTQERDKGKMESHVCACANGKCKKKCGGEPSELRVHTDNRAVRKKKSLIFGIDFDGTVVENTFPQIGSPYPGAVETLKELHEQGHRIIIWTCRTGQTLEEMRSWLHNNAIHYDAINDDVKSTKIWLKGNRKVFADYYLDDRSWPPFTGWAAVHAQFVQREADESDAVKITQLRT
jgi:hypothetical protein